MRKIAFAAPLLAAFALFGCTQLGMQSPVVTTTTGKSQVSLSVLGSDLTNASLLASIAADALVVADAGAGTFAAEIRTSAASVQAAGISLEVSGTVIGDVSTGLIALKASLNGAAAGVATVSLDREAKVQAALHAVDNALTLIQFVVPAVAASAAR